MRKTTLFPAPVGRLHDPLGYLAERVHRALTLRRRIVSVDDKGRVFVDDEGQLPAGVGRSVIGAYDVFAMIRSIETDLRLALRQRAARWIVDWNVPMPVREEPVFVASVARRRRRRLAADVDGKRPQYRAAPTAERRTHA